MLKSHKYDCVSTLQQAGFSYEDAAALRRISLTLHRWHELECGDSNAWNSFCIVRGKTVGKTFEYDDNGKPYLEVHHNSGGTSYFAKPDAERGAQKRLGKIMAKYPCFAAYVQGDPRGASLYILRPGDVPSDSSVDSCYNRGVAVCR